MIHLALLLASVATTLLTGFALAAPPEQAVTAAAVLRLGSPYAAALLGILATHEMGHYLMARRHGVVTTLPFFIPGPPHPWGVGTFGAVIRVRSPLPSRTAVFDVGAAGPLAGLAVAIPLLFWGLAHSTLLPVAAVRPPPMDAPFDLLRAWWDGRPVAEGGSIQFMGDSAITWAATRLVWGQLPPGQDVLLHPVAFAAWLGLLVTALNLVPIGQLDGGHVTYALFGRARALRLSRVLSWALLAAGFFLSFSWLVWWALARFLAGPYHPQALEETPLGPRRRAVAWLCLLLFGLTFVPVPMSF